VWLRWRDPSKNKVETIEKETEAEKSVDNADVETLVASAKVGTWQPEKNNRIKTLNIKKPQPNNRLRLWLHNKQIFYL
jgi:hypothetical protein